MRPKEMQATIVFPDKAFRGHGGSVIGFTSSLSVQSGWGSSYDAMPPNPDSPEGWWQPRRWITPAQRQMAGRCYVVIPANVRWPSKHSTFINWVKQWCLEQGFDVIQKRAWKDGHMVDEWVNYIRTRKKKKGFRSFHIHDGDYMVRSFRKMDQVLTPYGDPPVLRGNLTMEWGLDVPPSEEISWSSVPYGSPTCL